jgi:hypothetical protein
MQIQKSGAFKALAHDGDFGGEAIGVMPEFDEAKQLEGELARIDHMSTRSLFALSSMSARLTLPASQDVQT